MMTRVAGAALVLIAEDEAEIADILEAYLQRDGFRTAWARDGREALQLQQAIKPDLVLLDVQMPHLDGWEVLSSLRQRGATPVIMLTALDSDVDKISALRVGADDYVVKPFNPTEVIARVRAVLRRSQPGASALAQAVLRAGALELDRLSHSAWLHLGAQRLALPLTATEFRLLQVLAGAPTRVFSRAELIEACLPEGDAQERTIDSHLSKLRKKIEQLGLDGMPTSVRGVGYCLQRP
ncbi:MAG: response regulator [Roseateles asaccharophilus]|uniref:response regulator n=1 Tax=Roseateles asaccharophilus TaxID=582607 RepID=UPI00391995CC